MTIGEAISQAASLQGVGAVEVGAWTMRSTETARRWMSDRNAVPGEALEILRQKLAHLPALLDQRAVA